MKKVMAGLIVLAMKTLATTASVEVVLTIQSLKVESVKVFNAIVTPVGSSKVSNGRAVFRNLGNGTVDFSVRIASTTGAWTPFSGTGVVPQDQYRLRAIWTLFNAVLSTTTSFDDNDILTSVGQLSTSQVFFSDNELPAVVGIPSVNGGFGVQQQGVGDHERHMFFRFDAGASGTTGSVSSFINVSATSSP